MPAIRLKTAIAASPERCFDLARDVTLHQESTAATRERAVAGITLGLMGLNDTVTWEATHFGLRFRLTSKIVEFERPIRFVDEMVKGPFRRLRHEHVFQPLPGPETLMIDVFEYQSPFGILGRLADLLVIRRYLGKFLRRRNAFLKRVAER